MDKRRGWATLAAAACIALGGCAAFHHDDDATVGVNAARRVPGSVVSGGGTKGTLNGGSVGGIIGHEATSRP